MRAFFACASFSVNFPLLNCATHLRRVSHPPNLNTFVHQLRCQFRHQALMLWSQKMSIGKEIVWNPIANMSLSR